MALVGGRALTTHVAGGVLCACLIVGCALTGDEERDNQPTSVTPTQPSNPYEAVPRTL